MDKDSKIDSLEKIITSWEIAGIVLILFTLVPAVVVLYNKGRQNALLKEQRKEDLIKIAEAEESSSIALKDAAYARERAAISEEKAKIADVRSKELEIELYKLKLEVGDRYIPPKTAQKLKEDLISYKNKDILIFVAVSNDREPLSFARNLESFFVDLGWRVKVIQQNNVRIPPPTGIVVRAIGETNKEVSASIQKSLNSLNYDCQFQLVQTGEGDVNILVFAH